MNKRTLGRTGLKVSELGFGALEIGRAWPYWRKDLMDFPRPDESRAVKTIHAAIDAGINFFDTAPAYQFSEEMLGKALKGIRPNIILATKCGEWFDGSNSVYDYSYSETRKFIANSLKLLQTDFVDLLQIHSASVEVLQKGETLRAMKEAQKEGKARFLGLSTDSEEAALLAIEQGEWDAIQVSYNVLKQGMSNRVFVRAAEQHVGIIVKDGLSQGKLTDKFIDIASEEEKGRIASIVETATASGCGLAEMAIRFVLSHPGVATVIIGTKSEEHLAANLRAVGHGSLDAPTLKKLRIVS